MKKAFYVRLEENTVADLTKISATYHIEPTAYGAMVLAKFSELKPEFALHALTAIPKEYFRTSTGRPTATTARAKTNAQEVA